MPQIDFYVLSDAAPDAHLRYSCRLAEQAVEEGKRVFIRTTSSDETKHLDELLWTFGDRSFLPHEVACSPSHERVRILIGESQPPPEFSDLLINFAADVPTDLASLGRVAEIVAADAERKRLARERFKRYRDQALQPESHNV